MDKKKGIIVLLIAVVAILYFGTDIFKANTCSLTDDADHVCVESTVHGCDGHTCDSTVEGCDGYEAPPAPAAHGEEGHECADGCADYVAPVVVIDDTTKATPPVED